MELSIVEKWQHGSSVELFYNNLHRRLVFKKFNYIYSKNVDDLKIFPYLDLQEFSGVFLSCCFSPNESILAFQRNTHDLEFLLLETNQHFVLYGKNKNIIGYHWLSQSLYGDIVVLDSAGIEFYKLFPKLGKILTVRNYQLSIGHYWFESTEGVIVAASSPPKLGQFSTFFINQDKGAKFFNGQRFSIDLSPSVTNKWTESPSNISRISGKVESASVLSAHSVCLAKIYGTCYFIHINSVNGSLSLFVVSHEKVLKAVDSHRITIGHYGIRVIDNLLVLQNYTLQETYIMDIKSSKYKLSFFYTLWNDMRDSLPEVSLKLKVSHNSPLFVSTELFYDGKTLSNHENTARISDLKGSGAECALKLDDSLYFIDKDICIDTKEGRCYKLHINPVLIIEKHPDQAEAILFLFRRVNCKMLGFGYLKKCIKDQISIKVISEFFRVINGNYKIAALEKKNRKIQALGKQEISRTSSFSSEPDMRVDESVTFLLQSEFYSILFQPLFEENNVNNEYFSMCLNEYIRSLMEQDIQIQHNLQILLGKVMLRSSEYLKIQQFIQYRVLSDSMEMASILLTNSNKYSNFLFIAIDMMFRIRAYDKLIEVLLENDFILETVKVMQATDPSKFDIKKIVDRCKKEGDGNMIAMLLNMIKEQGKIYES